MFAPDPAPKRKKRVGSCLRKGKGKRGEAIRAFPVKRAAAPDPHVKKISFVKGPKQMTHFHQRAFGKRKNYRGTYRRTAQQHPRQEKKGRRWCGPVEKKIPFIVRKREKNNKRLPTPTPRKKRRADSIPGKKKGVLWAFFANEGKGSEILSSVVPGQYGESQTQAKFQPFCVVGKKSRTPPRSVRGAEGRTFRIDLLAASKRERVPLTPKEVYN